MIYEPRPAIRFQEYGVQGISLRRALDENFAGMLDRDQATVASDTMKIACRLEVSLFTSVYFHSLLTIRYSGQDIPPGLSPSMSETVPLRAILSANPSWQRMLPEPCIPLCRYDLRHAISENILISWNRLCNSISLPNRTGKFRISPLIVSSYWSCSTFLLGAGSQCFALSPLKVFYQQPESIFDARRTKVASLGLRARGGLE